MINYRQISDLLPHWNTLFLFHFIPSIYSSIFGLFWGRLLFPRSFLPCFRLVFDRLLFSVLLYICPRQHPRLPFTLRLDETRTRLQKIHHLCHHIKFLLALLSLSLILSLNISLSHTLSPRLPPLLYPKCIESLLVWNLNFSIPLTIFISFSYLMNSNLSLTFPWLYHWLIIPAPKIETSELITNLSVGFTILFRQELLMTVDVSFLKKKGKRVSGICSNYSEKEPAHLIITISLVFLITDIFLSLLCPVRCNDFTFLLRNIHWQYFIAVFFSLFSPPPYSR